VIYVFLQIYGWKNWLSGGKDGTQLAVSGLAAKKLGGYALLCAGATQLLGWSMASFTDAAVPYFDAFTTVASLIAQWLTAQKKIECWYFWIAVDIVATGVYYYKELFFTAGLYGTFLFLAISGLVAWNRTFARSERQPAESF
jgi:nicotinamide mononucleotide transporter